MTVEVQNEKVKFSCHYCKKAKNEFPFLSTDDDCFVLSCQKCFEAEFFDCNFCANHNPVYGSHKVIARFAKDSKGSEAIVCHVCYVHALLCCRSEERRVGKECRL